MWPAIIGAVGGIVGNTLTKDYNNALIKRQQQYNTSEREASQQFQNQQRELQNQFAEDMYNKYQSPQALAYQYSQAGLNPRLAMKDGGAGSIQASSGSSGGAPSGAMSTMPYMQSPDFTQGFMNMANVLKSMADAKKAGVETSQMEHVFSVKMRQEFATAESMELANRYNMKYGDQERMYGIAKTVADINSTEQQVKNAMKEYDILCNKYHISKYERDNWLSKYVREEAESYARAAKDRSQALLNESMTKLVELKQKTEETYPALNRSLTRIQNLQGDLLWFDKDTQEFVHDASKNFSAHSLRIAENTIDRELDYLEEQLELAQKTNNTYYLNMIRESAVQIIGIAIGIGMYRNGSKALQIQQQRFGLDQKIFDMQHQPPMGPIGF